jgi:hypothetical protein
MAQEVKIDDTKLIKILAIYADDNPEGYGLLKNYIQQVALEFAGERMDVLKREILKG